ncbi:MULTISPECIES: FtsL-like putative cell division protein [Nonlabens]|uniref:S-adenosyl-methyltransferase n=1 Tax=Nonlabens agnitus TaxID=870484 RepID=A0A2S9WQ62_9FLAO|nr:MULTISPECIES: FtsL-like putative cell division protein [Nonlabens]KQC32814.1 S-adenosyl-methyltransferase [Nonlabens sp. YIK11]PRP65628.1 S-adenosyl-methyltransferase [Nonlabens agnitus]
MAAQFYDILRGNFLTNRDALKNWKFILFVTGLALIMIYTGHNFESKVHYIGQLNDEVSELRSQYVDGQRQLMFLQMESTVASRLKETGIAPAKEPPYKLIINTSHGND